MVGIFGGNAEDMYYEDLLTKESDDGYFCPECGEDIGFEDCLNCPEEQAME